MGSTAKYIYIYIHLFALSAAHNTIQSQVSIINDKTTIKEESTKLIN